MNINEIEIGQHVTIDHWHPRTRPDGRIQQDQSWVGEVLRVKAISGPFVVVIEHDRTARPFSLDTRRCELAPLSPEFVAAMNGDEPPTVEVEDWPDMVTQ